MLFGFLRFNFWQRSCSYWVWPPPSFNSCLWSYNWLSVSAKLTNFNHFLFVKTIRERHPDWHFIVTSLWLSAARVGDEKKGPAQKDNWRKTAPIILEIRWNDILPDKKRGCPTTRGDLLLNGRWFGRRIRAISLWRRGSMPLDRSPQPLPAITRGVDPVLV